MSYRYGPEPIIEDVNKKPSKHRGGPDGLAVRSIGRCRGKGFKGSILKRLAEARLSGLRRYPSQSGLLSERRLPLSLRALRLLLGDQGLKFDAAFLLYGDSFNRVPFALESGILLRLGTVTAFEKK